MSVRHGQRVIASVVAPERNGAKQSQPPRAVIPQTAGAPPRGFTLVELLVAIAIFVSLMAGITLLFVNATRTVQQGFQAQEAFDLARTALRIIENDLSRAFTSRDYGDYYNFYGTPIGFTFVGLVAPRESDPEPNLARVTYVVYHDNENPDLFRTVEDEERRGFKLLRYVEPNRDNLDTFPVQWGRIFVLGGEGMTLENLIGQTVLQAVLNGVCTDADFPCHEQIRNAKKRELWIRMLAGGDAEVPSAWTNPNVALVSTDPRDWLVTENILYVARGEPLDQEPRIRLGESAFLFDFPAAENAYYFTYHDIRPKVRTAGFAGDSAVEFEAFPLRYWNDARNYGISNAPPIRGSLWLEKQDFGSPFLPRIPQQITTHFDFFFPSPWPGAPDFRRAFDQRVAIPTGYRRLPSL